VIPELEGAPVAYTDKLVSNNQEGVSMGVKQWVAVACASVTVSAVGAEVTYRQEVAPMLKKYCAECHSLEVGAPSMADFKLDEEKYKTAKVGPRVDTYEHLLQLVNGMSAGAFMRRLDDGTSQYAGGKPGNMYKHLCEKESADVCAANLAVLKAWVGEGGWNLNRMSARGEVPALTKEQLDKLKMKY
jgi:hypothetical protein